MIKNIRKNVKVAKDVGWLIPGLNVKRWLFLIFVGYKAFAETPELMPLEAKSSLMYLFAILPAIFSILAVIPMIFYKLTGKKHKEITKELEERRQRNLNDINQIK